jgi:Carboxypeptidase regulatory-like domain/TonB dependent receptor
LTFCHRHRGAALIASTLLAPQALSAAEKQGGGVLGWVENTQGMPVAGAVISLFGKGIRGGSLVTLSDTSGQFFLPSLPAGSYTLRALGRGHEPAPAQTITVLAQKDSVFTVSLTPVGESGEGTSEDPADGDRTEADRAAAAREELKWLLRHKRRSVLEYHDDVIAEASAELPVANEDRSDRVAVYVPALAGTFEVVATPAVIGDDGVLTVADGVPTSLGVLRLHGKMADFGEWRLGGLVTESENTAWRMAAEFVLNPGDGHEIQTGGGYGTRYVRPLAGEGPGASLDARSVGSLFAHDTWRISEGWTAGFGARHSYVGFLHDANSIDGYASLERALGRDGTMRGSVSIRTLAPGGDLLTLSTLGSAPVLGLTRVDDDLRAERIMRYQLGVDRSNGGATFGAFVFREHVTDQLVNIHGMAASDALRIVNGGGVDVQGVGMSLEQRFGNSVNGSLTYCYGRTSRHGEGRMPSLLHEVPGFSADFSEGGFHDLVARLETFIELTDTRLTAYYRVNTLDPKGDATSRSVTNSRFDIRLSQGLPFMQPLTRADWELLVAVRNLFYDELEGGMLDEVAVLHPTKRVMGGIAVKF